MPRNQNKIEEQQKDNPALSKVIERNIRTIIHLRTQAARERSLQGRLADTITFLSGWMLFAYVHIVWFALPILLNTGRFRIPLFDPFPYALLTMIVSLEAIFLSTFVLICDRGWMLSRRSWVSWTMRTVYWQTWKWNRSWTMYWPKPTAFNPLNSARGELYASSS